MCTDDKAESQKGSEGEEEEEEEEESEEQSEEDEVGIGGYSLRKRRPVIYQYQPVIQVRTVVIIKGFYGIYRGVGSISHLQLCSWCYNWCMKFIPPVLGC